MINNTSVHLLANQTQEMIVTLFTVIRVIWLMSLPVNFTLFINRAMWQQHLYIFTHCLSVQIEFFFLPCVITPTRDYLLWTIYQSTSVLISEIISDQ